MALPDLAPAFLSTFSLITTLFTILQWSWPSSLPPSPISEPSAVWLPRIFQFQISALLAPFPVVGSNITFIDKSLLINLVNSALSLPTLMVVLYHT